MASSPLATCLQGHHQQPGGIASGLCLARAQQYAPYQSEPFYCAHPLEQDIIHVALEKAWQGPCHAD